MNSETTRREFIRIGGIGAAGIVTAGAAHTANAQHQSHEEVANQGHEGHAPNGGPALTQPGPGGPFGSPTDRGKLVSGHRSASDPPVPVEAPDLPKLSWELKDGVKEFHLTAQPVQAGTIARRIDESLGLQRHHAGTDD